MVGGAAFLNALLAVFALGPAMIHGAPRRRVWRRLRLFAKHVLLVFAYVTYISVAALVVLKMGAPGGYADQVGMTQPVARLVLIALTAAVALGLFWWLKRELGDHTRDHLSHTIAELTRHARNGYDRGQRSDDRGERAGNRTGNQLSSSGSRWHTVTSDSASDDPDKPLTGPPVNGRPPGSRPGGSAGHAQRPKPHSPSPPGPPANPAAAGGAAAVTKDAGVAAVAPQVAAAAVVVDTTGQRRHQRRQHADSSRQSSAARSPTGGQPHQAAEDASDPLPPGRCAQAPLASPHPTPAPSPTRPDGSPAHGPDPSDPPASGRSGAPCPPRTNHSANLR